MIEHPTGIMWAQHSCGQLATHNTTLTEDAGGDDLAHTNTTQ